jgi:uncharacterized protein
MEPRDTGAPLANPGRGALLSDPQGAAVGLWQAGQHFGAGLVNDPGAMAWNHLVTSELSGRLLVPETSISIGRIAVAGDPQGATFTLYEGKIDP